MSQEPWPNPLGSKFDHVNPVLLPAKTPLVEMSNRTFALALTRAYRPEFCLSAWNLVLHQDPDSNGASENTNAVQLGLCLLSIYDSRTQELSKGADFRELQNALEGDHESQTLPKLYYVIDRLRGEDFHDGSEELWNEFATEDSLDTKEIQKKCRGYQNKYTQCLLHRAPSQHGICDLLKEEMLYCYKYSSIAKQDWEDCFNRYHILPKHDAAFLCNAYPGDPLYEKFQSIEASI